MWKGIGVVMISATCGFAGGVAAIHLWGPKPDVSAESLRAAIAGAEQDIAKAMERRGFLRNPEAVIIEKLGKPPAR